MPTVDVQLARLLDIIVEHLDVPRSYYEKAAARHRSLGEFLHRKESAIAAYGPDVRPQGSFRYGTVIWPLRPGDSYDLDNVCLLRKLGKSQLTQKQLKELYGAEILAYAKAHGMNAPPSEHNRCWRLNYADEVEFHLDTLPCVPEDPEIIQQLILGGVPEELAQRAVAITDRRHLQYGQITSQWPSSNPRGFAAFFERQAALGRDRSQLLSNARAAVEDVPPYEWKTTLQRAIQILKRHRDVMFQKNADLAPISMIITNLAARAYGGEADLLTALRNIVNGMTKFVRASAPYVPNPADPAEDYAEKWVANSLLKKSFEEWHTAVSADLRRLPIYLSRSTLGTEIPTIFQVSLTRDELQSLEQKPVIEVRSAGPTILAPVATKPWGRHV